MTPHIIYATGDQNHETRVAGIDRTYTNDSLDSIIAGPEVVL